MPGQMLSQAFNIVPDVSADHTQLRDVTSSQPFQQLSIAMDSDQSSGIEDGLYSFKTAPHRRLDHQFASGVEQPFRLQLGHELRQRFLAADLPGSGGSCAVVGLKEEWQGVPFKQLCLGSDDERFRLRYG